MRTADAVTKIARAVCVACRLCAPHPIVVPSATDPKVGRCSNRQACDRRLLRLKTLTHQREAQTA